MRKPETRTKNQNQKQKKMENSKTTIPYVVQGLEVLRNDNADVLNKRIQSRYTTEIPLAPSFDPRPVQTKYTRFGVQDEYRPTSVPIEQDMYPEWKNTQVTNQSKSPFTIPTKNGPPLAYYMNLDKETALQRQGAYMFNSKNLEDDSVYQPPQQGDLYQNQNAQYSGGGGSGEYSPTESSPYLFVQPQFSNTRTAPSSGHARKMEFNQPTQPRGR